MSRLIDPGLERLRNMILDMAKLSEKTVAKAVEAYTQSKDITSEIYQTSVELDLLKDQISTLAVELTARYQPAASDLRFIVSCMEIAYGFARLGRYSYDIVQVLQMFGDVSNCDHEAILKAGDRVLAMIRSSIKAFSDMDTELARSLQVMDDAVDRMYSEYVKGVGKAGVNLNCAMAAALVLRYLERIADHACYIADSVTYIATGEKAHIR